MRRTLCGLFLVAFFLGTNAAARGGSSPGGFAPLEAWRAAILAGDAEGLRALYSVNPPATVSTPAGKSTDLSAEVQFWSAIKAAGLSALDLSEIQRQSAGEGEQTIFQTTLTSRSPDGPRKLYVSVGFLWQKQGDAWRIVACQRNDPARLPQPLSKSKDLYPAGEDAHAEIQAAVGRAAGSHKRVLLVFGGNWCYDCHVLDAAFHTPEIAPLLKPFEVVHVDIGEYDKNLDIAERYEVPLKKGVPAVAVLESDGKLLYSQKGGEFEKARSLGPEDIVAFLKRWKPAPR